MSKSLKILIVIIVIVILIALALFTFILIKPNHYILEKQAGALEENDEVIIENKSYFFQNKKSIPDDESLEKFIFLNAEKWPVTVIMQPSIILPVKKGLPWWKMPPKEAIIDTSNYVIPAPVPLSMPDSIYGIPMPSF